MKKKLIASLSVVTISVALIAGVTLAWFTGNAKTDAKFKAGTVAVGIKEGEKDVNGEKLELIKNWNPGDSDVFDFDVPNLGTKKAYVRVKVTKMNWDKMGEMIGNVKLSPDSNWVMGETKTNEGQEHTYYYYKEILDGSKDKDGNDMTAEKALMKLKVELDGEGTGNDYQGDTFNMKLDVEAIQASNDAILSAWNISDAVKSELEGYKAK
ncbi:TasA family protein [Clostridium algidicarnis]|uniref:Putative ribosomally synthesized peptide with SipW-like signal peptide n=1 Tax=Clostridium algidicarnis DSM 15099 TaxID=1121295 RepID=A0A2S6FZV1_9CLOT|nr:TasA family protein [Clostridium algidicarnis]PPK49124.1 putative ribosomally synthesized peptide with SipW-like signal peptide [Clostridium algidicarnis DSM 15099]